MNKNVRLFIIFIVLLVLGLFGSYYSANMPNVILFIISQLILVTSSIIFTIWMYKISLRDKTFNIFMVSFISLLILEYTLYVISSFRPPLWDLHVNWSQISRIIVTLGFSIAFLFSIKDLILLNSRKQQPIKFTDKKLSTKKFSLKTQKWICYDYGINGYCRYRHYYGTLHCLNNTDNKKNNRHVSL